MNAIPYDRPEEDWERYEREETDEALPGRPRRQFFNRGSAVLLALVLGAIGFYVGVRVEKGQVSSSSTSAAAGAAARFAAAGTAARTGATGATARTGAASGSAGAGSGFGGGAAAAFGGGGGNASFGTVSNVSGNSLYVTDSSGNLVKVALSGATKVTKSVGVSKSAVRPGDTVIIRGIKGSNGTLNATSVTDSGTSSSGSSGGSSAGGSSGGAGSAVGSLFGSGGG